MLDDANDLLDHAFTPLDDGADEPHGALTAPLSFSAFQNDMSHSPLSAYVEVGDPDGSGHIAQTTAITCAVVSQQMVLNDFGVLSPDTGQPLSEAELTYVAAMNGWLHDGTSPEDAGRLLDYYGVPNHHGWGIDSMVEELRQGHSIIVGVDSDELWKADNPLYNDLKDYLVGEAANHAIVVKGVIYDGSAEPIVVVNDPGSPDGAGNQYPLSVFMDAFEDGNCHYVATDIPPPGLDGHERFGANFDAEAGVYNGSEDWYPTTDFLSISSANTPIAISPAGDRTIGSLSDDERMKLLIHL